jgi:hypothetical protein
MHDLAYISRCWLVLCFYEFVESCVIDKYKSPCAMHHWKKPELAGVKTLSAVGIYPGYWLSYLPSTVAGAIGFFLQSDSEAERSVSQLGRRRCPGV